MTTKVGLESYEVMACHGAYDFEHIQEQPFVISIWATLCSDVINDDLNNTLNYADLQACVDIEVVNGTPARLMETLCERIIAQISSNSLVCKIEVRIEKPNAPLPHPGGLAVVEREWSRV